eukprot:TRINITY_DN1059_c0_g2_i1.p1 TRINITY_DN1059_c0_g2~~TRINITY_DN1059_c0_g2_i1.p1  ORF type:complete len:744 (-),score=214.92 TRINITY_DN1059_c0_g2_i1:445-2676(-)
MFAVTIFGLLWVAAHTVIPASAQEETTASVILSFAGGNANCSDCVEDFACNFDRPGLISGNWNNGTRNFTDPLPVSPNAAWIVVQLQLTLVGRFNCAGLASPSAVVQLAGASFAIELPAQPSGRCACLPDCVVSAEFDAPPQPSGWPAYNYADTNQISVVATNGTTMCLSSINVTLTYIAANPCAALSACLISPTAGPTDTASDTSRQQLSPTTVSLFGQFVPEVLYRCYFGPGTDPVDVENNSSTAVTCQAPSRSTPDSVHLWLEVVTSGQHIDTKSTFTYYVEPQIVALYPPQGNAAGNYTVLVSGTNFTVLPQPVVHCSFDGQELPPSTFLNDTFVSCQAVPGTAGSSVDLRISQNGQQYTNALVFSYTADPPPPPPPSVPEPSALPGWLWVCLIFGGATAVVGVVVVATRRCTQRGRASRRDDDERQSLLQRGSDGLHGHAADGLGGGGQLIKQLDISEVKLLERIGKGTFGEVYRGIWSGTEVGVKFLSSSNVNMNDDQFVNDFRREITIMRACRHPCVVQFLGAGTDPSTASAAGCCIVMEYMPMGSLYKILHDESIRLDLEMIRKMLSDAARGMNYLHKSDPIIIHRDLKSHNLLVDENWKVKVSDFGLSKICETAADFTSMTACGTPSWTAPEILRNENYTEQADVYSFGIVIWESLTRSDPFPGMPPFQVVLSVGTKGVRPTIPPTCPASWARLIETCWAELSGSRPSMDEVLLRLEQLQHNDNLLLTLPFGLV